MTPQITLAAITKLLQEEFQGNDCYVYNGRIMINALGGFQDVGKYQEVDGRLVLRFNQPVWVREFLLADPDCFVQAAQVIKDYRV